MSGNGPRLSADFWLEIMERQYLHSYVHDGGTSLKATIIDDDGTRTHVWNRLKALTVASEYAVVEVDSVSTKVHLMQSVFHTIAEQVPWESLAEHVARKVISEETGFEAQPGHGTLAERMATQYGLDVRDVKQALTKGLRSKVLRDAGMARDFRYGMLPLCRDASGAWGSTGEDSEAIHAWLRGEPMRLASIKSFGIFARISRANAMLMLESLAHWLREAGHPGLVLLFDIRRLVEPPPRPRGEGHYYTRAALLDAYEVMRQIIDATDRLEGVFTTVFANTAFLDPDSGGRGIGAYQALNYRLSDAGISASVANPLASLVRLER